MAITLTRSGDGDVTCFEDFAPDREILVFDPVEERGQLTIGDRFRSLDSALQNAEIVVVRSSSRSTIARMESDPILKAMFRARTLLHLGRSYDASSPGIRLTSVFQDHPVASIDLQEIRQAEIETLLRRNNAIFDEDNHHYLLPSGWHADRFVRLGNACASVADNRRIADWVLGHVQADTDLIGDTGTLLPLLQEVQRHCQHRFGWRTKIDALTEYPSIEVLARGVEDLRSRSHGERGTLFVVSVNSSGASHTRFGSMVRSDELDSTLVLCETDPAATPRPDTLALLPANRWAPAENGECEACGSPARVVVHPTTYEPASAFELHRTAVTPATARASADLFEALSGHDAIRLHYDSPRGTHYAVWIDTPVLLGVPEYAQSFIDHISSLGPVDLALVPAGPAEDQLMQIAETATGGTPHLVEQGRSLDPATAERVRDVDHVLVVDDTIVSGVTLARIRRSIYQASQPAGRNPRISVAAFLARPSRAADLTTVQRPYRTAEGLNVHPLHQALLPPGSACSFCNERQLLRASYPKLSPDGRRAAQVRLDILDSEMTSQLFLGSSPGQTNLIEAGSLLTAGAFFGDLTEVAGFAAAASAVQQVLDDIGTANGALHAHIIDVAAALDAYFDPCLLVGILRTCKKEQVRFATTDTEISSRYTNLADFGGALTDAVRCEIGWASLREVLPLVGVEAVVASVESVDGDLIRELIALRTQEQVWPGR